MSVSLVIDVVGTDELGLFYNYTSEKLLGSGKLTVCEFVREVTICYLTQIQTKKVKLVLTDAVRIMIALNAGTKSETLLSSWGNTLKQN